MYLNKKNPNLSQLQKSLNLDQQILKIQVFKLAANLLSLESKTFKQQVSSYFSLFRNAEALKKSTLVNKSEGKFM